MIIKIELDIPTHESEQVNQYASDERQEALGDLCESYGIPRYICDGNSVEFDPAKIIPSEDFGSISEDIQMSVGGLVLELMAFEKEWNSPDRWELVERAVESNNFVEP